MAVSVAVAVFRMRRMVVVAAVVAAALPGPIGAADVFTYSAIMACVRSASSSGMRKWKLGCRTGLSAKGVRRVGRFEDV